MIPQAAAVTHQNSAAVARDVLLPSSVEGLPPGPARGAVRHAQRPGPSRARVRASAHFQSYLTATASGAHAPPLAPDWPEDRPRCPPCPPRRGSLQILSLIVVPLACFGLISGLTPALVEPTLIAPPPPMSEAPLDPLVDRITLVESRGNPDAKNKRSSATGAGQFLDDTWLELIRAHRRELLTGRTTREVLSLRRNIRLSREMTRRFIERNAAALAKRGLPVTPGALYLAHFAGPAGAVAILTARDDADAAAVIAAADSRAAITRAKILNSNSFLRGFTVRDLKNWANVKTGGLAAR